MTAKELASSKQQLATAHSSCMQVAADHEATVASRKEELKVIAEDVSRQLYSVQKLSIVDLLRVH